jgi:hypothetical protein
MQFSTERSISEIKEKSRKIFEGILVEKVYDGKAVEVE